VKRKTRQLLKDLVKAYDLLVKHIDVDAKDDHERVYGGSVRAAKGTLVESVTRHLLEGAWSDLGGDPNRLEVNRKRVKVPIERAYVDTIEDDEIREYILANIDDYCFGASVDHHVFIDGEFALGVESKAYAENAMLKRILVDFTLLKKSHPELSCVLLQLESQLGGDYSAPLSEKTFGSPSTRTLLSHFDVGLRIVTLLEGERKVNEPIHKPDHYKSLKLESLERALQRFQETLEPRL
jgi:hypothetical protein